MEYLHLDPAGLSSSWAQPGPGKGDCDTGWTECWTQLLPLKLHVSKALPSLVSVSSMKWGNAVSCGGMWSSYEMASVNRTQKWQRLQGWEKPTLLFLHSPTQAPATHDLLSQFFLLYCILKNCHTFFLVKSFNVDFRYLIPGQKIPIQHPKCLLLVARCWETQKIVKTWFQPWGRRKLVLISTVVSTQVREKLPKEYEDRITL